MKPATTDACRRFAYRVVSRLTEAGFTAYWAGGCVRDQLFGRTPKDYDVATNAKPEQVRELFGRHRTLSVGQSFGVITVLGGRSVAPIEVATFREDVSYSDGRHPDAVRFSHAREDALRRDFTINGLFYDPIQEQVVDFVEGQRDLELGIVRAIGDPEQRLDEDKLRMLRAIRFAADFDFEIAETTFAAVQHHAIEIQQVSAERISNELHKMLVHPRHSHALELLRESGLWQAVFPEIGHGDEAYWQRLTSVFSATKIRDFSTVLAFVAWAEQNQDSLELVESICRRLKVSNQDRRRAKHILENWSSLAGANETNWAQVQPILVSEFGDSTMDAAIALQKAVGGDLRGTAFCQQRLAWPLEKLDPRPLITGHDLKRLGFPPGPEFRRWLDEVRSQQLLGALQSREEAIEWLQNRQLEGFPPDETE